MKLKYLSLILLLLLFTVNSFGQKDFTVEISLENANFWSKDKLNPLEVKITNKSEEVLNTKDFKSFTLYFSKCSKSETCNISGDKFVAYSGIKEKKLKKDEKLEFNVNLADFYWMNASSSNMDFSQPKNIWVVPISNKYFYTDVAIFDGYSEIGNSGKTLLYKRYESNEIIFETRP